jgi:serine/threonine protein kinase
VNIGKGKFGPVDLIIVNNELRALKRINKVSIDNPKRIEHVKQEK